jgi:hypothetical protein
MRCPETRPRAPIEVTLPTGTLHGDRLVDAEPRSDEPAQLEIDRLPLAPRPVQPHRCLDEVVVELGVGAVLDTSPSSARHQRKPRGVCRGGFIVGRDTVGEAVPSTGQALRC